MALNGTQKFHLEAAKDLTAAQLADARAFVTLHFNGVPNPNDQLTVAVMQILATNYSSSIRLIKH